MEKIITLHITKTQGVEILSSLIDTAESYRESAQLWQDPANAEKEAKLMEELAAIVSKQVYAEQIAFVDSLEDNPPPITKEKAGCGKLIHIAGTNGGRMPCGEKLTRQDGTVTIELCPLCKAKGTHA